MELRGFLPGFPTSPVELLFFFFEAEGKRTGTVLLICKVGTGEAGTCCLMKRSASSLLLFSLLSTGGDVAFWLARSGGSPSSTTAGKVWNRVVTRSRCSLLNSLGDASSLPFFQGNQAVRIEAQILVMLLQFLLEQELVHFKRCPRLTVNS